MAKTNQVSKEVEFAPELVGEINGREVYLSARVVKDLSLIPAGEAREAFRQVKIAAAMSSAQSTVTYLERRNKLEVVETDKGFIAINGTGTRQSGIFSPTQMLEFLKPENLKRAKALAEQLLEQKKGE